MRTVEKIKKALSQCKEKLKTEYGITEIGIFGSYLREEQKKSSDLDILIDFGKTMGLIEFVHLENFLSDLLGIKVDLVMKSALKPRIGKHILKEVVYL